MKNVIIKTKTRTFIKGDSFLAYRGFNNYLFSEEEEPIGKLIESSCSKFNKPLIGWEMMDFYATNRFEVVDVMRDSESGYDYCLLDVVLADELEKDEPQQTETWGQLFREILLPVLSVVVLGVIFFFVNS